MTIEPEQATMPRADHLPTSASRVLIAANPTAGPRSGRLSVEGLAETLKRRGYRAEILDGRTELPQAVEEAINQGDLRAVVAAGGDGTVAEAANNTPLGTPLAILPLGTENLAARYLATPANAEQLVDLIAEGVLVRLDAGRANSRIFLLMAGCGFDAEVVRLMAARRRGHIQHLSYIKPILEAVRTYQYPPLRIYCDDRPAGDENADDGAAVRDLRETVEPIEARWAFIVNLPRYAGGLRLAPDAVGTDGLLDLCAFQRGSLVSGLRYLGGVLLGAHRGFGDCVTRQVRRVLIDSDHEVPYQLDGDPGGHLPLEIILLPNRLTFVVARQWALKHGWTVEPLANNDR